MGNFAKWIQPILPLSVTATCSLEEASLAWRQPGCPVAMYREGTWASLETGHLEGKSEMSSAGFLLPSKAMGLPTTPNREKNMVR